MNEQAVGFAPKARALRAEAKRRLRSRMLCDGVFASAEVAQAVARSARLVEGFIHGTVFLIDDSEPVNTAFMDRLQGRNPVELKAGVDGGLFIEFEGWSFPCPVLPYFEPSMVTADGLRVTDYFTRHSPSTLFAAPVRQCIFISIGKPCTFCTFEGGKVKRMSPESFIEALDLICVAHTAIEAVAIGGGTPNLLDFGAGYYGELARLAAARGLAVSIEIVPPRRPSHLDELCRSGVDSLIMSIEVWDEHIRSEVCLGKGELSRAHYVDSWRGAVERLGRGNVASVLLAGLEPPESTLAGVEEMISLGVIPTLIAYRAYRGIVSERQPNVLTADAYLALSVECARMLSMAGLDPAAQKGCTQCGGCSLEVDICASPSVDG